MGRNFQNYEHGLKLIREKTGKREFLISAEGMENPDQFLNGMIQETYRASEDMAKKDYYEVLGVKKNATEEEIKKAFRKLAMNITRIATRGTSRPRSGSRRSTRRTRC